MAAFFAFDFKVHARAQNIKGITAAGVVFLHNELVAHTNVHAITPFKPIPLYYNTFCTESIEQIIIIGNTNHIIM